MARWSKGNSELFIYLGTLAGLAVLAFAILWVWPHLGPRDRPAESWLIEPAFGEGDRPDIDLPTSRTAIRPTEGRRVVEVGIEADGTLWIGGDRVVPGDLMNPLRDRAEIARDLDTPSQPSRTPVIISADGAVPWRSIEGVMQACAHPAVRIWRVYLAVRTPDGERAIDVHLQKERGMVRSGYNFESEPPVKVELSRTSEDRTTMVKVIGAELGNDAFDQIGPMLTRVLEQHSRATVELNALPEVPYRQVVRTLDQIRGTGVERFTFKELSREIDPLNKRR